MTAHVPVLRLQAASPQMVTSIASTPIYVRVYAHAAAAIPIAGLGRTSSTYMELDSPVDPTRTGRHRGTTAS